MIAARLSERGVVDRRITIRFQRDAGGAAARARLRTAMRSRSAPSMRLWGR